jgi:hypothetical protein
MSPLDAQSKAIRSSTTESLSPPNRTTRPRRPDFNVLAADEYRRALRSLLQAKGEHLCRSAA